MKNVKKCQKNSFSRNVKSSFTKETFANQNSKDKCLSLEVSFGFTVQDENTAPQFTSEKWRSFTPILLDLSPKKFVFQK